MRDIGRISHFLYVLRKIWENNFPDWRFGQLMVNFIKEYGDPFYMEDHVFIDKLLEFSGKYGLKHERIQEE